MQTVKNHYDHFLGSVYSWILGDFESARAKNAAFFASLGLEPRHGAVAVDLGCGPGCQSLPLAASGYEVIAIDFCEPLLDELRQHAKNLPVRAICNDIANFRDHLADPVDLIVCMGDTLVHLPDLSAVESVIDDVCASLRPGGRFIYGIRDYQKPGPVGVERFVPIRASEERIFTCFLDYQDDFVQVHDILYEKVGGHFEMRVSDYRKLRLESDAIDRQLESRGLATVTSCSPEGMITGIAESPR